MKKLYMGLISIIIISMLTISGIAIASAKPGPTPTPAPISTAEQIQNQRLTSLETNDTNQSINNTEQQNWISGLFEYVQEINKQLALLGNRVMNLENDPYPAIYSVPYNTPSTQLEARQIYEVNNLAIDLPKDAYVVIQTDGQIMEWIGDAWMGTYVDGYRYSGKVYGGFSNYPDGPYNLVDGDLAGFEDSTTIPLSAGKHTITVKVMVSSLDTYYENGSVPAVAWASIRAIAYDKKGNVVPPKAADG